MSSQSRIAFPGVLIAGLLLASACSDVSITTVDPAVVEIQPATSFLPLDGTSRLTAQVRSSTGAILTGRTITWESLDPGIAEVDDGGNVHGLAPGTATIRATTEGISGTATVTVITGPAQPAIALGSNNATLTATQGGANPAPVEIALTNAGGGTLTGLAASVTYSAGQPTGWLSAELGGSTAPTLLALRATTGALAVGSYTASVTVSSAVAMNSPQLVLVTFQVQAVSVPGAPTGLNANAVSASRIDLSWGAASGSVQRYRIERRTGGGSFALLDSVTAGTLSYADAGLAAATQYAYRVQACNATGCSAFSGEASATTHSTLPLTPAPPGDVSASATSSSQITLTWSYGADPITHFELQRAPGSDPGAFQPLTTVGAAARSYADTGLDPASTFHYRARACNLVLCSEWSAVTSATTPAVAPATPGNLAATAISESEIRLTWNAAAGALTYELQRRRGSSGNWDFRVTLPVTQTEYLDTGLDKDTRYQYQVRACAGDLCSSYSNTATATTFK